MKREIRPHPAVIESIIADDITDAKQWLQTQAAAHGLVWSHLAHVELRQKGGLQTQAAAHGLVWLLAHADDGVIWGRVTNGQLVTSHDAAQNDNEAKKVCPPLRIETLQQARLFAERGELLLWRDGDNIWHARLIREARTGESPEWDEAFDECQMLWGTHGKHLPSDFTLLEDGAQGLRHAVPRKLTLGTNRETTPPRLLVRHYINKASFTRVIASRLVDLS